MNIKGMHYDLKSKLNKVDSQQYRNLKIPEIDWKLNEAANLFRKLVANPRIRTNLGFETTQRTIDDIKTIVVKGYCPFVVNNIIVLPEDYSSYIKGEVYIDKGECVGAKGRLHIRQHDDEFERSPFDKSSFEWRTVNGVFYDEGIKVFDDGTFEIKRACIDYIKKIPYMHNAEDFRNGSYKLPGIPNPLTGTVDCILPEDTHREIVDIAVMLIRQDISGGGSLTDKMQINQLL